MRHPSDRSNKQEEQTAIEGPVQFLGLEVRALAFEDFCLSDLHPPRSATPRQEVDELPYTANTLKGSPMFLQAAAGTKLPWPPVVACAKCQQPALVLSFPV